MPLANSVIVIGGGPAGGVVSLELAQAGCAVVLLERQPASGWKIGETLPPESRRHLQRLGHWERFAKEGHLPCHGVVSTWGQSEPIEKEFIFNPYGHGWQLDRAQFEAGLLEAAVAAGCDVQSGVVVDHLTRSPSGWLAQTANHEFQASWLVDCTGRSSTILQAERGPYEQIDDLVAVYSIGSTSHSTDRDSRTWVESYPEGWCYSALMPNGCRMVAVQTDADLLPDELNLAEWFDERLAASSKIGQLLRRHGYRFPNPPRRAPAHSGRFRDCVGPNWIAVGDAAMTFDPLSGQGSAKALESASHAVQTILHQRDYQGVCEQLWREFLVERREYYLVEHRWRNSPFWSRRHRD